MIFRTVRLPARFNSDQVSWRITPNVAGQPLGAYDLPIDPNVTFQEFEFPFPGYVTPEIVHGTVVQLFISAVDNFGNVSQANLLEYVADDVYPPPLAGPLAVLGGRQAQDGGLFKTLGLPSAASADQVSWRVTPLVAGVNSHPPFDLPLGAVDFEFPQSGNSPQIVHGTPVQLFLAAVDGRGNVGEASSLVYNGEDVYPPAQPGESVLLGGRQV